MSKDIFLYAYKAITPKVNISARRIFIFYYIILFIQINYRKLEYIY